MSLSLPSNNQSGLFSQDDYLTTPREPNLFQQIVGQSPMKKKRSRLFYPAGANNSSSSISILRSQSQNANGTSDYHLSIPDAKREDSTDGANFLFTLSQDEINMNSQCSQDFTDRFGQQLKMNGGPDDSLGLDANSQPPFSNLGPSTFVESEMFSRDGFQSKPPYVPFSTLKNNGKNNLLIPQNDNNGKITNGTGHRIRYNKYSSILHPDQPPNELDRQIKIAPPIINPFIFMENSTSRPPPANIWISPYKERSRYLFDFHQEGILGQGISSVVYSARRRLDGAFLPSSLSLVMSCFNLSP